MLRNELNACLAREALSRFSSASCWSWIAWMVPTDASRENPFVPKIWWPHGDAGRSKSNLWRNNHLWEMSTVRKSVESRGLTFWKGRDGLTCAGSVQGRWKMFEWKWVQTALNSKEECETFGFVLMRLHGHLHQGWHAQIRDSVHGHFTFQTCQDMDFCEARGSRKGERLYPFCLQIQMMNHTWEKETSASHWVNKKMSPWVRLECVWYHLQAKGGAQRWFSHHSTVVEQQFPKR